MAGATGLEPATFGVTGRHSNQLSYAPAAVPLMGQRAKGAALEHFPQKGKPLLEENATIKNAGGAPHLSSKQSGCGELLT